MATWVMNVIFSAGYAGIALLMFIENVFPPIPSELIMPLAGFMATKGQLALGAIIAAGTIGSILGALPLYFFGRSIGERRLKELADRHGRWFTVSCRDIDRAKDWFERYGVWAVFACRLVPGIRSLISIPAGLSRMKLAPFLIFSTAGAALWTTLLATAGYALGANFNKVEEYLDPVSYLVFAGLVVFYVVRIIRHERQSNGEVAQDRSRGSA